VSYDYHLIVDDNGDGTCTASIDGRDGPLRATGANPIAALRELVKVLADWQEGGSERWLNTPDGVKLARQFVPDFEPRKGGAEA
jgi:hypothetical protein